MSNDTGQRLLPSKKSKQNQITYKECNFKYINSKDNGSTDQDSAEVHKDQLIENLQKQLKEMQKEIEQKSYESKNKGELKQKRHHYLDHISSKVDEDSTIKRLKDQLKNSESELENLKAILSKVTNSEHGNGSKSFDNTANNQLQKNSQQFSNVFTFDNKPKQKFIKDPNHKKETKQDSSKVFVSKITELEQKLQSKQKELDLKEIEFKEKKSQLERRIVDLEKSLKEQSNNTDKIEVISSKNGGDLINVKISKTNEKDLIPQKNNNLKANPAQMIEIEKSRRKSFANPTYLKNLQNEENNKDVAKPEVKQLKLFHMNLGEEEDEKMDKKSLGYKIRKALRHYISK